MENLEDDLGEILATTTPDLEVEAIATMESGTLAENLNDSFEIIERTIEEIDLTSPQPSTSSNSAGAIGVASSLVKTNLEETFKSETTTDSLALDQNPSTSTTAATVTSNVLECPICLQTCIHPARLPCGHIFCFLCVKGVAYKNRRCAMCRREIPPEFLDHPQLVNGIEDICTTKATDDGYQWFYEGRNGGWWAYEKRNASEIEEAFQYYTHSQKQLQTQEKEDKIESGVKKEQDEEEEEEEEEEVVELEEDESDDDDVDYTGIQEGVTFNKKNNITNPGIYNIQICGNLYTVDFKNMLQYPHNMPYRKRKMCRAKGLHAKGIAGLINNSNYKKNRRMKPY